MNVTLVIKRKMQRLDGFTKLFLDGMHKREKWMKGMISKANHFSLVSNLGNILNENAKIFVCSVTLN